MTISQKHKQAWKDYQSLHDICEVDDLITWADEVEELLQNPTKKKAFSMIENAIFQWFKENYNNPENIERAGGWDGEISQRYGAEETWRRD